ncbi:MAG: efflux RND transporter permease subunit [Pseudomonadota bacterium]
MVLITPFLTRPRLTALVITLSMVLGLAAILTLPRQEDPMPQERYATVQTFLPGASAKRIESLLTEPIEDAVSEVPEVRKINSFSRVGVSVLAVELDDTVYKTEEIWSIVRNKIADIEATLPSAATKPELDVKLVPAVTMLVAIKPADGRDISLGVLNRLARELQTRLNNLSGTEETVLYGEPEEEFLVVIDAAAAAQAGLSAQDISAAIARADAKSPAGLLRDKQGTLIVEVAGELTSVDRIASLPLRIGDSGQALRVGDVAQVTRTVKDPAATLAFLAGKRGIAVASTMQPEQRVDLWAQKARAVVADFKSALPDDILVDIVIDQSVYTQGRLIELSQNFIVGIALVVAILYVLMGWRSAVLVGLSLPLSICIVLGALSVLDVPLHQMSVTGAIIALGLLIDNAIVVVDDYNLLRRRGARRAEAATNAVKHLQIPLLASTLTTAFTFAPIMLMPGGAGDFVGTMALTVILAISSSLFVSLTVIPSLAAFVDKKQASHASVMKATGLHIPRLAERYRAVLNYTIGHPRRVVGLCVIVPLLGFVMAAQLDEQFFPPVDRDQFQIQLTLPADSPIQETEQTVAQINAVLDRFGAEVVSRDWFIGESPPKAFYNIILNNEGLPSFAAAIITTSSAQTTSTLVPELQRILMAEVVNAEALVLPFDQGPPIAAPVEVRVIGNDLEAIRLLGEDVRRIMSQSKNVTYTRAQIAGGRPKAFLDIDEAAIASLGLRLTDITTALRNDLDGALGGSVLEDREELPVRVRLDAAARGGIDTLLAREVLARGPDGLTTAIPLSAIASVSVVPEEATITRYNRTRSNNVQGFVTPFTLPSIALKDFKERLAAADLAIPPGVELQFGGESETQDEAIGNLLSSVGVLMVLMIGTVILTFDSFRFAGAIMSVALLSVGIAFVPLFLFDQPRGFMAIVGAMGLIGLAINGAIVVMSALRSNEQARQGDALAIRETVVDCTRHIVGTTLTTVAGFLPLLIWGQNFWKPLALAIAGGVLGSSLLALFYIPALFTWIAKYKFADKAQRKPREAAPLGAEYLPAAE